jgi:3-oxoacyl-[acyl-carrier protein] reductase
VGDPNMFALAGKKALVTGASGGIGGAIARMLHGQGATVALAGRNRNALDALAAEVGDRCHVIVGDLGDTESSDAMLSAASDAMDGIDVLVNNAGLTRDNLAMRMKDDDWQAVIDVNLTATFRMSRAVMRGMMKARWGRIINVTSIVGVTGNPGQANYAASKAGIIGMSKSLAGEVATRGITVNCIGRSRIRYGANLACKWRNGHDIERWGSQSQSVAGPENMWRKHENRVRR